MHLLHAKLTYSDRETRQSSDRKTGAALKIHFKVAMWCMALCCRSKPATRSTTKSLRDSAKYAHNESPTISANNDCNGSGSSSLERDFSMEDILQSALTGRRMRHPSTAAGDINNFPKQPSMTRLLLSSWCARQFLIFKALWVQAATHNQFPCTDHSLTLHEMYLLQHLQQGSAMSHWGCSALPSSLQTGSSSHNKPSCSRPNSSPQRSLDLPAAVHPCRAHCTAGSSDDEDADHSLSLQWKMFAEPPDCPVTDSLVWAAAAGHNTRHGSAAGSCGSLALDASLSDGWLPRWQPCI